MTKQFKFTGTDIDIKISLFEYGFICSYDKKDDYYFIVYKISDKDFDCGHISEKSLNDLVSGQDWMNDEDITSFLSYTGMTVNQWLNTRFENKFSDLFNYYGYENIMGSSYGCPFTGYCMDNEITAPLFDFMRKPRNIDFKELLEVCFDAWVKACNNDLDWQNSDEYITDAITSNDYEFTKDGKLN